MSKQERIDELRDKANKLGRLRGFAWDRMEACRVAWLTGKGTKERFESWDRKRSEIGELYFATLDEIIELDESN